MSRSEACLLHGYITPYGTMSKRSEAFRTQCNRPSSRYLRQNTFQNKTAMTLLERIQSELDYLTNYSDTKVRILFDEFAIQFYELEDSMTDAEITEFCKGVIEE
jgi:hypothetical protein